MREKQQVFQYAGYEMRSHSETRWAAMMDSLDICWLYEPQVVDTRHGLYLPDFFLPSVGVFVEVKGPGPSVVEVEKAKDAEDVTGCPVVFAHGRMQMQGASLVNGGVTYFSGSKKLSFSSYELSEVVRQSYDMHTFAAFLTAGEHQPRPDSFSVGDILVETFTKMMDRQSLEQYLAGQHGPLNQAKKDTPRQLSRAELALSELANSLQEKRRAHRHG